MNNNFLDFTATAKIIFNLSWFYWLKGTSFAYVNTLSGKLNCFCPYFHVCFVDIFPLLWKSIVTWQKHYVKKKKRCVCSLHSFTMYHSTTCVNYQRWGSSAEDRKQTQILFFFFCVAPSYCKATKAKHAKIQPLNVLWHVWELKQTILIIMPLILQNWYWSHHSQIRIKQASCNSHAWPRIVVCLILNQIQTSHQLKSITFKRNKRVCFKFLFHGWWSSLCRWLFAACSLQDNNSNDFLCDRLKRKDWLFGLWKELL